MNNKKPLIIDTDIGDDIDDVWALGIALASGAFDLRLVSVCYCDAEYKLKVAADIISRVTGATVPLAAGRIMGKSNLPHAGRVANVPLPAFSDAAKAIARAVEESGSKIDILAIGPLTNIADFTEAYPHLKDRCRIVLMGGSLRQGYLNQSSPCAEFNFFCDPAAVAKTFESGFEIVMAPLDVCRDYIISGGSYQSLKEMRGRSIQTVLDYYNEWQQTYNGGALKFDINTSSTILYDVIPVLYLLDAVQFRVENLKVVCDGTGFITESSGGAPVAVLTGVDKEAAVSAACRIFGGEMEE